MPGKKSKKIYRKRESIFKNKGAVNNGAFYVAAILMLLVFVGYYMIGGTLPSTRSKDNKDYVAIYTPAPGKKGNQLQLYTFLGATYTPTPPPPISTGGQLLPTGIPLPSDIPIPPCTHYVAKNGNDGNPGTEAQPWLTIQKAANTAVAGNTVCVKTGTYNEQVSIKNSGTSNAWITFAAYPGQTPVVDGTGINMDPGYGRDGGLIQIWSQQYIRVTGFTINNSGYAALYVNTGSDSPNHEAHDITLDNNTINGTWGSAIQAYGHGNKLSVNYNISRNTINRGHTLCDPSDPKCEPAGETLSVGGGISNFTISYNTIVDSWNGGFDSKDGVFNGEFFGNTCISTTHSCFYVDGFGGGADNIRVHDNIVYNMDNFGSWSSGINVASEQGGVTKNIYVYNNIVYNNPGPCLRIARYNNGTEGPLSNVQFLNNTCYNNGTGSNGKGGIILDNDASGQITGVVIKNNIFSQNTVSQIINNGINNVTIENNLIDGPSGINGNNSVTGNPLFVSLSDFHLKAGSPAIDKGTSTGAPAKDFDGKARPQGGGYDIGAYEYGGCTDSTCNAQNPSGKIRIMGTNHPNLWYNQAEIDKLRAIILGSEPAVKKTELITIYNTRIKGAMAVNAPTNWFTRDADGCCWTAGTGQVCAYPSCMDWKDSYLLALPLGATNMKAGASFMIEPSAAKAQRIKAAIFSFVSYSGNTQNLIDPQNTGHSIWPLAWLYDLTYNEPGLYTTAEKTQIETFFRNIASAMKTKQGNGYPLMWKKVYTESGVSREGYENWYAFYAGQGTILSLVGNSQALLDYFTKSQSSNTLWYTPTSQGVTNTYPNPTTSNIKDLYQYVNGMVYPSGKTWDFYVRINDGNKLYHEFSLLGIYLGLEAAAHNGWNGWNENIVNGKPAMQRAIEWQIQYHPMLQSGGRYPAGKAAFNIRRFYNSSPIIQSYVNGINANKIDDTGHSYIFGDFGRVFIYPMYD